MALNKHRALLRGDWKLLGGFRMGLDYDWMAVGKPVLVVQSNHDPKKTQGFSIMEVALTLRDGWIVIGWCWVKLSCR